MNSPHYREKCPCCNGTGFFAVQNTVCPRCQGKGGLGNQFLFLLILFSSTLILIDEFFLQEPSVHVRVVMFITEEIVLFAMATVTFLELYIFFHRQDCVNLSD